MEYIYAAALLLTEPGTPIDPAAWSLSTTIQDVALDLEIMDPREIAYVLARESEMEADLTLLRRRLTELAAAPPLADALRFPDRAATNDVLAFNRAYRQHLEVRQPGEPARCWELRAAIQETDRLYQVWDTVRDARCDYYYATVRRTALLRLREALGEQAYYAGQMPPWVPSWRFEGIR